jgi:hypothetical protein
VPPHQSLTAPTKPANRPLATQGPSPARARPAPASGSPEFGFPAPAGHPRGDIAKKSIFPRVFLQKGISNSVAVFLILVNCVENYRKSEKYKANFVGFVVNYSTTFVILA